MAESDRIGRDLREWVAAFERLGLDCRQREAADAYRAVCPVCGGKMNFSRGDTQLVMKCFGTGCDLAAVLRALGLLGSIGVADADDRELRERERAMTHSLWAHARLRRHRLVAPRLLAGTGVSSIALDRMGAGADDWDRISFPEHDGIGGVVNCSSYRPAGLRGERWRRIAYDKESFGCARGLAGTHDELDGADLVVVAEGAFTAAAWASITTAAVVGVPGASSDMRTPWLEMFPEGASFLLVPDHDVVGRACMRRIGTTLVRAGRTVHTLDLLPEDWSGDDLVDFAMHNDRETTVRFVRSRIRRDLRVFESPKPGRDPHLRERVKDVIEAELSTGPKTAKHMYGVRDEHRLSRNTFDRAAAELGVLKEQVSNICTLWSAPPAGREATHVLRSNVTLLGILGAFPLDHGYSAGPSLPGRGSPELATETTGTTIATAEPFDTHEVEAVMA